MRRTVDNKETMRNDTKANFLFAGSALLFAGAFTLRLHDSSWAASVFYFLAQSAFIGSAADWFAVTALFRKPLGFPFHTALIPRNRPRIIRGIRGMVEGKLLRPDLWSGRISGFSLSAFARRETLWQEEAARLGAETAQNFLAEKKEILAAAAEEGKFRFSEKLLEEGKVWLLAEERREERLDALLRGGLSLLGKPAVKEKIAAALRDFTEKQKTNPLIAMAIAMGEAMGLLHYADMAEAIAEAASEKLTAWRDPAHPRHEEFVRLLDGAVSRMLETPAAGEAARRFADAFLAALPAGEAAEETVSRLLAEWNGENGCGAPLRGFFREGIAAVLEDGDFCETLDGKARDFLAEAARESHEGLGDTVEQVLTAYDEKKLNAFIYEKVGEELGWIRINGALVAAAAGGLAFSLYLLAAKIYFS